MDHMMSEIRAFSRLPLHIQTAPWDYVDVHLRSGERPSGVGTYRYDISVGGVHTGYINFDRRDIDPSDVFNRQGLYPLAFLKDAKQKGIGATALYLSLVDLQGQPGRPFLMQPGDMEVYDGRALYKRVGLDVYKRIPLQDEIAAFEEYLMTKSRL